MSEFTLHFGCKRPITGRDFNVLIAMLAEYGFPVAPSGECGIRFGTVDGKDIQFHQCGKARSALEHADGMFKGDTTWKKWSAPMWSRDNRLVIQCRDTAGPGFSVAEISAIKSCTVKALGTAENIIRNENRGIKDGDLYKYIRLFLHFDRTKAINDYTTPSIEFPDSEELRLFQCWNCNTRSSHYGFKDLQTGFDSCLDMFNTGHPVWCDNCANRGHYQPSME
jgi:hypothetical protein